MIAAQGREHNTTAQSLCFYFLGIWILIRFAWLLSLWSLFHKEPSVSPWITASATSFQFSSPFWWVQIVLDPWQVLKLC